MLQFTHLHRHELSFRVASSEDGLTGAIPQPGNFGVAQAFQIGDELGIGNIHIFTLKFFDIFQLHDGTDGLYRLLTPSGGLCAA